MYKLFITHIIGILIAIIIEQNNNIQDALLFLFNSKYKKLPNNAPNTDNVAITVDVVKFKISLFNPITVARPNIPVAIPLNKFGKINFVNSGIFNKLTETALLSVGKSINLCIAT